MLISIFFVLTHRRLSPQFLVRCFFVFFSFFILQLREINQQSHQGQLHTEVSYPRSGLEYHMVFSVYRPRDVNQHACVSKLVAIDDQGWVGWEGSGGNTLRDNQE